MERRNENDGRTLRSNINRRSALKSMATGASLFGLTGIATADEIGTDDNLPGGGGGCSSYPCQFYSDSSSASNSQFTAELSEGVHEYEAYSPYGDYWRMPFEISANAFAYRDDESASHEVHDSSITLTFPSNKVYSEKSRHYAGGTAASGDTTSTNDYEDYAGDTIEFAASFLPGWSWIMDAGLIASKMAYNYVTNNDSTDSIQRSYNWADTSGDIEETQVNYWLKFIAKKLSSGENIEIDVENWTGFSTNSSLYRTDLTNSYTLSITAPSTEPSTNSMTMTQSSPEIDGYRTVSGRTIKANPDQFALGHDEIERLDDDQQVAFAAGEVEVTKN